MVIEQLGQFTKNIIELYILMGGVFFVTNKTIKHYNSIKLF